MGMEVFLYNVPGSLNARSLKTELDPFMSRLGILDWLVERHGRQPMAWIRFLNDTDGSRFLEIHGSNGPKKNQTCRLKLLGSSVSAEKSKNTMDRIVLSALGHAKQERERKQAKRVGGAKEEKPPLKLSHHIFACGYNMFMDEKLYFIQEWSRRCSEGVTKFGRRMVIIKHHDPTTGTDFRAEIPYMTIVSATHSTNSLTLVLSCPPRFFRVNKIPVESAPANPIPVIFGRHSQAAKSRDDRLPGVPGAPSENCQVLRLEVFGTDKDLLDTWHRIKGLEKFECTAFDIPARDPLSLGRLEVHAKRFGELIQQIASKSALPFEILFQVVMLVNNNFLHPRIATGFLQLLRKHWADSAAKSPIPPFSGEALRKMASRIDYAWVGAESEQFEPAYLLGQLLEEEARVREDRTFLQSLRREQTQNKVWVLRANITPTRITLHGPELESMNRILRKFSDRIDHFLRVQFADEDGEDLRFAPKVSYDEILGRFDRLLKGGIPIAGRVYGFLGFSHSSLRSRAVWMSAPFVDSNQEFQTYNIIIKGLGDFGHIRVPAKCAARIGQAFSETAHAIPLRECGIGLGKIVDVKTADGKRVFSDGVGTITRPALDALLRHMDSTKSAATCFQIRLGSAKGMIALDARQTGKKIIIRPESMMKFPCDDWDELGICEMAGKPLKMFLNRQLIKIMEDMGVKESWFEKQQKKELDLLRQVTSATFRTVAFLDRQTICTNFGFPKFLSQLEALKIDWRRDDFMRSAVSNIVMSEVRQLKHKSRIPITKGVTLFGIMDETGFLNEGEIYVAFDTTYEGTKDFIDANVWKKPRRPALVTRSPALHPGDVQLVNMVRPPDNHSLRELQNCIVFPRHGSRDLPSQLSGGDLDGDKYHVIWDPEAIVPGIKCFPPADYPRMEAKDLDRDVEKEDIIKHFLDFMKSDQLGVIATKHIILSDQRLSGTADQDCKKLAEIHSTAVDFSKSGIPVDIRELHGIRMSKLRPDFLAPAPPAKLLELGQFSFLDDDEDEEDEGDGPQMHYYPSEKVLGKLYNNVDEKKIWHESVDIKVSSGGRSVWDQLISAVNREIARYAPGMIRWENKTQQAWRLRSIFDGEIEYLRQQYTLYYRNPLPEVDVFCGNIFNKNGTQNRRERDYSAKLREDMIRMTDWLSRYIRWSGTQLGSTEYDSEAFLSNRDAIETALACVMIMPLREEFRPPTYGGSGKLQSFRIVAAACLVKEIEALKRAWGMMQEENGLAMSLVDLSLATGRAPISNGSIHDGVRGGGYNGGVNGSVTGHGKSNGGR